MTRRPSSGGGAKREKRGEVEREDLSSNLVVQLGLATEELNRHWYQANSGQVLTDVQRQIRNPALRWMAATRQVEHSAALSASLTEELVREIATLGSGDSAAQWANQRLSAKNRLIATDAYRVEAAFAARLAVVGVPARESKHPTTSISGRRATAFSDAPKVDKSILPFPEPRRIRDRDHIKYVILQACLICGRRPSDAHHLRFAQLRALGRKASDEFTVPLCRVHHREAHHCGDVRSSGCSSSRSAAAKATCCKT